MLSSGSRLFYSLSIVLWVFALSSWAQPPGTLTPTPSATVPPGQVVTVTVTASSPPPAASTCPACFNCAASGCANFGECKDNVCNCLDGFGGQDCSQATCGSANRAPENRAVRTDPTASCCEDGFLGVNCNVCARDDGCKPGPGAPAGQSLVCNKDPAVWKKSHSYCEVLEPLLKIAYPQDSFLTVQRNRQTGDAYGSIWYTGVQQFACHAFGCTQSRAANKTAFSCPTLKCKCIPSAAFCGGPGGNIDLSGSINGASGDLAFTCPRGSESPNCVIRFGFLDALFPNGFKLGNCLHGECAQLIDDPGDDPDEHAKGPLGAVGIAAISAAGFIVGFLALALGLACFRRARAKNQEVPANRKGVQLSIRNLSYVHGKKRILESMSGDIYPGRALAIMGPSGSGKSTLIDIIAGKTKRGDVEGAMLVNDRVISKPQYKRLTGFVDQDDILMETLTVRETLMFSAKMRLPESMSLSAKEARVTEVIETLGLSHVANSRIGGATRRGISGGEKRRVSIGQELVTSPAILFLDEPTSGLDSYNAHSVIKTICELAHKFGKTIVFTIHQPRSDVYAMFDDIAVLQRGNLMYFGEADKMERHFTQQGHPCPAGYNIADWVLDLAVGASDWEWGDSPTVPIGSAGTDYELRSRRAQMQVPSAPSPDAPSSRGSHNHSPEVSDTSLSLLLNPNRATHVTHRRTTNFSEGEQTLPKPYDGPEHSQPMHWDRELEIDDKGYHISFLTQMSTLLERGVKNFWRRPVLWLTHLGIAVGLGAFVGGLYWQADASLSGIQNRFGSIFFIMSLLGFSGLSAIGTLSQERQIFIRERANGFYGTLPFLICRILFDLIPLRVIPSLIMGTIAFFMVGFTSTGDNFVSFIGVLSLFAANAGLLCMAVGTAIRDIGTANLVGSLILLFHMLFAGFLLNQDQIPAVLRWIQYLSLFRYAYEALVVNDISGITIVDDVANVGLNIPASIVLDKFGFDRKAFTRNVAIEGAWFVFFLALIALLTAWKLRERR
ncbi:hypothetical protein PhCBS80983_g04969 [Powellomyces hirtus]|uniref:ABC transporter domain-containing protein n=1 Tax=Powellomyces hirtus TaxID=109895 RepID=A0A507DXG4_9FUNG|nr:hypothetical protein PhCBS80983_g04969 [Powellomyces hirtus]